MLGFFNLKTNMYSVLQACNTEKTPLSGTALAPICTQEEIK